MKNIVYPMMRTAMTAVLFFIGSLTAYSNGLQLVSPANNAIGTPQNQLLKWESVSGADQYKVQVAEDAEFVSVVKDVSVEGTETSFYSEEKGLSYYWKVEAYDGDSVIMVSDTWKFTVYTDQLPAAPFITYPTYDNAVFTGNTFKVGLQGDPSVTDYSLALIANTNLTPPDTYWLNGISNSPFGIADECWGTFIFHDTFIFDRDNYDKNGNLKKKKKTKKGKKAKLCETFAFFAIGQNENGFGDLSDLRHFRKTNHLENTATAADLQVFASSDIDDDNKIELIYNMDNVTYLTEVDSFDELGITENGLIEPVDWSVDTAWISQGTVLPISNPITACYGYFNNDETVDIAILGSNSKIMLRTSTGFQTSEIDLPAAIDKVFAYDINRDGLDDILYKNTGLIGGYKTGVNLTPPDTYWLSNTNVHDFLLEDINNDFHKDIIVIEEAEGTFESRVLSNNYPDFNTVEVIPGKVLHASVSVNGTPVYTINYQGVLYKRTAERVYILGYGEYDKVFEKDLDGDGLEEIIAVVANVNRIVAFKYVDGEYSEIFQNESLPVTSAFMSDFTGDGKADMLTSSPTGTMFYKNFEETELPLPAMPLNPRFSYSGTELLLEWDVNLTPPDTYWLTPPDTYWLPISNNYKYQIELADEDYTPILTAYSQYMCNDDELTTTTTNDFFVLPDIAEGIYNWRVRTVRPSGAISAFTSWQTVYTQGVAPLPPASWLHEKKTGSNATIIVENSPVAMYEGKELETGDAVGVFYQSGEELVCGGYAVMRGDGNFAMTAWGDNKITEAVKDGFIADEEFKFKLWDADEMKEIPAYGVFNNGAVVYSKDEKYYVNKFDKLEESEIFIPANKVVYVSSPIKPYNPFIGAIVDEDIDIVNLTNDEIKYWDSKSGYILYSAEDKLVNIAGQSLNLNHFSVSVSEGVNLIPYVLNYPTDIESIFENPGDNIIAVKDNEGRFYIPSMKINNIKLLNPNSAYMVYADSDFDMTFSSTTPVSTKTVNDMKFKHYSSTDMRTGHSMGLVIDCADLDAGDEVIIKDVAGRKLGSAVSQKGRAVVSVWGDNPFTHEIEGAANGELLIIEVYHNSLSKEIIPRVKYSKSLINKRASELVFTDNELLVVEVELNSAITNVIDGEESCMINVYPNPAHDYIIIGINCDDAIESMSIYDVSGARVANVNKTTGNNKIRFNVERFNSGVYFLRTKIGSEIYENKIIVQ